MKNPASWRGFDPTARLCSARPTLPCVQLALAHQQICRRNHRQADQAS